MLVATLSLVSCYNDFESPDYTLPDELTPTHTIAQFKTLYATNGGAHDITDDIILEGRVTTSDAAGNFYKSIFIQDGTAGMEVRIGQSGLYNDYKLGQTVFVKAKGLRIGGYRGMVNLGGPIPPNYSYETSYIEPQVLINQSIFRGKLGNEVLPTTITSATINEADYGKLIRFENAVLQQCYYYDINNTNGGGNIPIDTWANKDYAGESSVGQYGNAIFLVNGMTINVRSSGYSKFAGDKIPAIGSQCNIEGILVYYSGGSPAYQISISSLKDIEVLP